MTRTCRAATDACCAYFLFEVKKPCHYCKLVDSVPAEDALRPLNEGGCYLAN